ncbi:MAG: hypothetical protein ACRC8Z_10835 [Empedobacter falsenii]
MEAQIIIPEGYALVPKEWANRMFAMFGWESIETPTISQVSKYTGASIDKIKADLKKYDCPLRKFDKGGRGKGNESKFFKQSVEQYKIWIIK